MLEVLCRAAPVSRYATSGRPRGMRAGQRGGTAPMASRSALSLTRLSKKPNFRIFSEKCPLKIKSL